jgi:hypothetical protein
VYLDRVGERYALVSLPPPHDLHAVPFDPSPEWIVDHAVTARADTAGAVSIFTQELRPTEIAVRVENGQDGGLWVGHRSASSHTAIAFFSGAHIEARIRSGDAHVVPIQAFGAISDPSFDLRVRMVDRDALVLYDETVIGVLERPDLRGRVGLFHHASGARPQAFHDLRIGEADWPPPVVEVPLDLQLEGLPGAVARLTE